MAHLPIEAVLPVTAAAPAVQAASVAHAAPVSFVQTLLQGVEKTNEKLVAADQLVKAFAVDDSIPTHQVAYALEAARMDFELAMQVRGKLLEAYQQLMNMQI